MKHRIMITALLLAAATALTPLTAAAAPVQAADVAADTGALAELPDWIPDDYYTALAFRNQYGASRIEDGLICLVLTEEERTTPKDNYLLIATTGVAECLTNQHYTMENSALRLRVVVYQPQQPGVLQVKHIDIRENAEDEYLSEEKSYTFQVEETDPALHTLEITETDIYGWLPDCHAEFDEYTAAHGLLSVHDNYVVFCMKSAIGTAYSWQEKSRDYEDIFELRTTSQCSTVTGIPVDGGTAYNIAVYQAVDDGAAKIEWEYGAFQTDGTTSKTLTADCVVTDTTQTVLLPGMMRIVFTDAVSGYLTNVPSQSEPITLLPSGMLINLAEGMDINTPIDIAPVTAESNPCVWDCSGLEGCIVDIDVAEAALPENYHLAEDYKNVTSFPNGAQNVEFRLQYSVGVEGDLDGDGTFGDADAALFSKWLLGQSNVNLADWHAADFTRDSKLDAVDLSLMKRALMQNEDEENELFIVERENAWVDTQQTDVYTNAMLKEVPEAVTLIGKISQKADALKHADTISWPYVLMDYGADTLYLPLKKDDDSTEKLMLSTFGSGNSVLDDPDVLALVRLLSEKGIYGVSGGFDFDESAAQSAPVAVAVKQTGGIAGVRNLWQIYSEDGIYCASYTDQKRDAQNPVMSTELTKQAFDSFMEQDFTPYYNQAELRPAYWDAYMYYTVYTYEGGITRASYSDATDLRFAIEDLIYGVPVPTT